MLLAEHIAWATYHTTAEHEFMTNIRGMDDEHVKGSSAGLLHVTDEAWTQWFLCCDHMSSVCGRYDVGTMSR